MSSCHGIWHSCSGCVAGTFILMLAAVLLAPGTAFADPPFPRYGTRLVDGDFSDWHLTQDYFATMYRAGNADKPLESWLYLRYDCATNTLFLLVRGRPNVPVVVSEEDAWVALGAVNDKLVDGSAGVDGSAPDFAWIEQAPAPGDSVAAGFEASITLMPGTHELIVHVNVWDDNEEQTSATAGFTKDGVHVVVDCAVPVDEASWGRIKSLYR